MTTDVPQSPEPSGVGRQAITYVMGSKPKLICLNCQWQVALLVKNPLTNAGDQRVKGSIPGWGRSPGEVSGYPLQYSCWGNSMGRGAWWATVCGVAESQTRLK